MSIEHLPDAVGRDSSRPKATSSGVEPPPLAPAAGSAASPAPLDPRRHPFRADLAAQSLYGKINAPRYSSGRQLQVVRPAVPVRRRPSAGAGFETEALFGETVTVYDEADGWAWVQLDHDGYVGYLPANALTTDVVSVTHRVRPLGTFVYPAPDMKAPPLMHLSINARLSVAGVEGQFIRLEGGGYVMARHVIEVDRFERDFVEIAERLVGTPYLWGGKTRIGIDCSGLVQQALHAAGHACPRDSDMQQAEVGTGILVPQELDGLERGDFVFWKGHVGVMSDGLMLVHANAHHMEVVIETLPEAAARVERQGNKIAAIKLLPSYATA